MPGIGIGISPSLRRGGGQSWSTYWATLISATVETAAPTHVVLTFPTAKTSLGASDFTIVGFTISSASWAGAVLTLVLSEAVLVFDGNLTVTFVTTGQTATVTNNVADDGNTVRWYDFSDITTLTDDGGGVISAAKDKLNDGGDISSVGTSRPILTNTGLLFDGINDYMRTAAGLVYNQPVMIYLVIKQVSWGSYRRILGGTAGACMIRQRETSPNIQLNAGTNMGNYSVPLGEYFILRVLFNGANSSIQRNNVAAVTGDAGTAAIGSFGIGTYYDADGSWSNIELRESIFRDAADDANVQAAIYSYLEKKHAFFLI